MLPLEAFMSRLIPHVQGCPQPVAAEALVDSAIEFCELSCALVVTTDPERTQEGVARYALALPRDTIVSRVMRVWLGSRELALTTSATASMDSYLDGAGGVGTPQVASVSDDGGVTLTPAPDEQSALMLTVRVAVCPRRNARVLSPELLHYWADPVIGGAVSRLASKPGFPYTDLTQAAIGRETFNRGVSRARVERSRSRSSATLTTAPRRFA